MDKAMAEKDSKNFEIIVHGIKSSSKMIGALEVSEHAKELENMAEEGVLPDEAGYTAFIKEFLTITDRISAALNTGSDEESEDEEVFVFRADPAPDTIPDQPYETDEDGEIMHFAAKRGDRI